MQYHCNDIVMGVMKMGITVPREGLEPTSLAFRASVLPLPHVCFPDVITPHAYLSIQLLASEVSADYYTTNNGICITTDNYTCISSGMHM